MKKILLLALGGAIGFVAAHQFSKTSTGKEFFENFDKTVGDVTDVVVEGYKNSEAEIKSALKDVENALNNLSKDN